jgi:hypothetical protein
MITLEAVEAALTYLGETDNDYAMAKARFLYETQNLKTQRSLAFLENTQGTVADRQAHAETSPVFRQACTDYRDSAYEFERVKAKRQHQALIVETWRSISSARNHGQIV